MRKTWLSAALASAGLVLLSFPLALPAAAQTKFDPKGYVVQDGDGRVLEQVTPTGFNRWQRVDAYGRRIGEIHKQANGDLTVTDLRDMVVGTGVDRGNGYYDFYDAYGSSMNGQAALPGVLGGRRLGDSTLVLIDPRAPVPYIAPGGAPRLTGAPNVVTPYTPYSTAPVSPAIGAFLPPAQ